MAVHPDDRALLPQFIVFCIDSGGIVAPDRLAVFNRTLVVGVLEVFRIWNGRLSHVDGFANSSSAMKQRGIFYIIYIGESVPIPSGFLIA
jgi:hypothetical protein